MTRYFRRHAHPDDLPDSAPGYTYQRGRCTQSGAYYYVVPEIPYSTNEDWLLDNLPSLAAGGAA